MKNRLVIAAASLALSGCAGYIKTNEVKEAQAKRVPGERLMAFQTYTAGAARINVIRDSGFLGNGCYIGVEVARTLAAKFDPGEAATFYVEPGIVELSVVADPTGRGLCGAFAFNPVRENYSAVAGRSVTYRLSSRQYRRPELEEVEEPLSSRPTGAALAPSTQPAPAVPLPVPVPAAVPLPAVAATAAAVVAPTLAPAPSPAPPPAVPMPVPAAPVVATPVPPATPAASPMPVGQDSYNAARVAREAQCHAQPNAVMTAKGPGYENYSVACTNGEALSIKCEYGNCRILR